MARDPQKPILSRLGWFVGIWASSVLALGLVAYAIRLAVKG